MKKDKQNFLISLGVSAILVLFSYVISIWTFKHFSRSLAYLSFVGVLTLGLIFFMLIMFRFRKP